MSALTSLLVRDGVVSVRKIEEALQRQVIRGGAVETVLLEMNAVPENVLAAYCAALVERQAATREEVMSPQAEVMRLVPSEIAVRNRFVPLSLEPDGTLLVAVHEPLSSEQLEELRMLLGRPVDVRIVCAPRIAAGLARHYGAELAPRLARLIERLDQRDSGKPREPSLEVGRLAGHASDIPDKLPRKFSIEPVTEDSTPPPTPSRPPEERWSVPVPPTPRRRTSSYPALRLHRGPLTLAAAERMLRRATNRDHILEVLFSYGRQFFDYTALFVVQEELADGREAYGPGATSDEIQRFSTRLDRPSTFTEVRRFRGPQVRRLEIGDADRELLLAMRRPASGPALVMPIAIRQRVVLMLYGDRSGEQFDLGSMMELVRFGPRVVECLEQLILRKKRAGYHDDDAEAQQRASLKATARTVAATAGRARTSSRPQMEDGSWKAGTRPSGPPEPLREAIPPPAGSEEDSWGPSDSTPLPAPAPRAVDVRPQIVLGIPRSAPPPPPAFDLPPAVVLYTPDAEEAEPSVSVADEESEPEIVLDGSDEADVAEVTDESDEEGEAEIVVEDTETDEDDLHEILVMEADEEERRQGTRPASTPPPGTGAYRVQDAGADVLRRARPGRDPRRENDEPLRAEIVRLPSAVKPAPDAETRSVIVDMGEQVHAQVADLLRAADDPRRAELIAGLVAMGEAALPALVQAFPGPVTIDRATERRLPAARQLSPVAHALVAFGETAVPYVASLLASTNADVRFFAALVSTELIHPGLIEPIAERIHDLDPGVRKLACTLLPRFGGMPGFDQAVATIRRTARIKGRAGDRRYEALDAIAALRDVEALPYLAEMLTESDDVELGRRAHRALVTITGTDEGGSVRRWTSWIKKNKSRHRIEWLIDGLTSANEAVRAAVGEELKRLTQEYYGYYAGSPKRDREHVQQRYRRWWEKEGQRRFTR